MDKYYKISMFLSADDHKDAEVIKFEIVSGQEFTISREYTPACKVDPETYPEVNGFDVMLSIKSAIELRDFLIFALPVDKII